MYVFRQNTSELCEVLRFFNRSNQIKNGQEILLGYLGLLREAACKKKKVERQFQEVKDIFSHFMYQWPALIMYMMVVERFRFDIKVAKFILNSTWFAP